VEAKWEHVMLKVVLCVSVFTSRSLSLSVPLSVCGILLLNYLSDYRSLVLLDSLTLVQTSYFVSLFVFLFLNGTILTLCTLQYLFIIPERMKRCWNHYPACCKSDVLQIRQFPLKKLYVQREGEEEEEIEAKKGERQKQKRHAKAKYIHRELTSGLPPNNSM